MTKINSRRSATPESPNFKEKRGTILGIRSLLAWTLAFIGTWVVFKGSGLLDKKDESNLFQPAKDVQPAPAQNESKAKARKALKNLKIPAFKKEEEKVQEAEPPDNVGFGGPDPNEERLKESGLNPEKCAIALMFSSLPYEEFHEAIEEAGFDEIPEMKVYLNAVASLYDAIRYGKKEDIEKKALEVLRVGSFGETRESEFHKQYIKVRRKLIRQPNGRKKMKFIKKILVATLQYAKSLASF